MRLQDTDSACRHTLVGQHILSVDQFSHDHLQYLFLLADWMRSYRKSPLQTHPPLLGRSVLGALFFEASTRTRMSFTSAFAYLGGHVNSTTGMAFSSISKGETLADSIKVIQQYCDILVIRHPDIGSAACAAAQSNIPVINAGDGHGEHPTQALLDLYTIRKEQPTTHPLVLTIIGDLRFGRTVHSLVKLCTKLKRTLSIICAAPPSVQLPPDLITFLNNHGIATTLTDNIVEALTHADVIYSTRIQKERFNNLEAFKTVNEYFTLTKALVQAHCKPTVTLLHPLPRTTEMATDLDILPNAAYFRQAENGLYIRMALFFALLNTHDRLFQSILSKSP